MLVLALMLAACGGDQESEADSDAAAADDSSGDGDDGGDSGEEGESDSGGQDGAGGEVFEGEPLTIAVHVSAGGGYDWWARAFADEFEQRLDIATVVSNEPGAGGAIAYNNTFNAPADKPRIQMGGADSYVLQALGQGEGVHWDPRETPFIGRAQSEPQLLAAHVDSEFEDFQQLIDAEEPVRFASTGVGSGAYIMANALSRAYGFPLETIDGFDGGGEGRAALLRGEVDFFPISAETWLPYIKDGDAKPVAVVLDERIEGIEELEDTPAVGEYEPVDDAAGQIFNAMAKAQELHRSFWASPNMPEEQVQVLRDTYHEIVEDPEFQERVDNEGRELMPMSGEDMDALVKEIWNSDPTVEQAYIEILEH